MRRRREFSREILHFSAQQMILESGRKEHRPLLRSPIQENFFLSDGLSINSNADTPCWH